MPQAGQAHRDKHRLVTALEKRGQLGTQMAIVTVGVILSKEGTWGLEEGKGT